MFNAATVWKGLLYALLMFLAKLATGLWLVPRSLESTSLSFPMKWSWKWKTGRRWKPRPRPPVVHGGNAEIKQPNSGTVNVISRSAPIQEDLMTPEVTFSALEATPAGSTDSPSLDIQPRPQSENHDHQIQSPGPSPNPVPHISSSSPPERRVLRAYSPALLGLAMGARGEIGFLIASVAESHGIFSPSTSSLAPSIVPEKQDELYLVVVWAIVLCTIVGPVTVGGLVRRIKRLEAQGRTE